jgi:hypothetical protein
VGDLSHVLPTVVFRDVPSRVSNGCILFIYCICTVYVLYVEIVQLLIYDANIPSSFPSYIHDIEVLSGTGGSLGVATALCAARVLGPPASRGAPQWRSPHCCQGALDRGAGPRR